MRWIVLPLFIVAGSFASSQDFGPVSTRNHRALSLAFLRFEPRPNLLAIGDRRWEVSLTSANDFRLLSGAGGAVEEDYEVQRLAILYRQGLKCGWELAIEAPLMSRGGGFQDPIIDWWHANVLHWSDSLRDTTRFGRSVLRVPGSNFDGSADGLGDISLAASRPVGKGLVGSFGVKLPTGNSGALLGSGGFDAGAYIQGKIPLGRRLTLHAQAGIVWQGKPKDLSDARTLVHQEGLSIVWQRNSRDAWIAQWQGESSALQSDVPGSDATHRLLTFGYKRKLSSSQMLELFFSEDRDVFNGNFPEGANVGPDFTMGIRLGVRF